MAFAPPVRFTASVETRQEDEQQTVQDLNATFDKILDTTAKDYGHAVRSVHAKAHGIIQMTMHSKACLDATEQIATLRGERLGPRT